MTATSGEGRADPLGDLIAAMTDDETKQLLREIRDLQKAHYDHYVQFTKQISDSQRQAEAAAHERDQENDAYLQQQAAYQQEMRDAVNRSNRNMLISTVVLFAILGGFTVLYVLSSAIHTIATPMP